MPTGQLQGQIEIRNVGFKYGTRTVLEDVSLTIQAGEMIGLVGPSGSGRTGSPAPVRSDDRGEAGGPARTPVRRAGRPEDIAATCAFLVGDEAGYITGQIIGVNGGRNT